MESRLRELKRFYLMRCVSEEDGLATLFPGQALRIPVTDARVIQTICFYWLCHAHTLLSEADRGRFLEAAGGVIRRAQGEHEGRDVAIAAGSALFSAEFALELIEQGQDNAFNRIAARLRPGLLGWTGLMALIVLSALDPRSSSTLLMWMRLRAIDHLFDTRLAATRPWWRPMLVPIRALRSVWQGALWLKTRGRGIERIVNRVYGRGDLSDFAVGLFY